MNQQDLQKWHAEELDILKRFARYCDEFELSYFIHGGTLLGAVRHQGFIPWDDNVDVCMPRDDYNEFIERMEETNLPGPFRFLTFENTEGYRYPWARMISTNMKIINRHAKVPRIEHAYIDILPLDALPNQSGERYIHKKDLQALWKFNDLVQYDELADQQANRGMIRYLANKASGMVHGLVKSFNYKKVLRKINEELEEYNYRSDTEEVVNYLKSDGFRETFPRRCFEEIAYYPFEDTFLAGPKDYDTVLRIIYGKDYMRIPADEYRKKNDDELVTETWRK